MVKLPAHSFHDALSQDVSVIGGSGGIIMRPVAFNAGDVSCLVCRIDNADIDLAVGLADVSPQLIAQFRDIGGHVVRKGFPGLYLVGTFRDMGGTLHSAADVFLQETDARPCVLLDNDI